MLEETLLHKGSAEEWNSVMINEHLPGKPLQHNLDFGILGLYRAKNAYMRRGSRVEGGGDNNAFHDTSTSRSHLHILLAANKAATAYFTNYTINTYIQDELPQCLREPTDIKSSSRLGKDGEW